MILGAPNLENLICCWVSQFIREIHIIFCVRAKVPNQDYPINFNCLIFLSFVLLLYSISAATLSKEREREKETKKKKEEKKRKKNQVTY